MTVLQLFRADAADEISDPIDRLLFTFLMAGLNSLYAPFTITVDPGGMIPLEIDDGDVFTRTYAWFMSSGEWPVDLFGHTCSLPMIRICEYFNLDPMVARDHAIGAKRARLKRRVELEYDFQNGQIVFPELWMRFDGDKRMTVEFKIDDLRRAFWDRFRGVMPKQTKHEELVNANAEG